MTTYESRSGLIAAQEALRKGIIERITREVAGDTRVDAIWLYGSMGRQTSDALSDLDIVLVMAPGCEKELVAERVEMAERLGPVALALDSPQNAPPNGAQVNAWYDVEPLPLEIDWSFWPPLRERPSDVQALFEYDGVGFYAGRTYREVQADLPQGKPFPSSAEGRARFALAMTPIIAKFAMRGAEPDVYRMYGYLQELPPASADLATTLASLTALVDRLEAIEAPEAIRCVRRYLREMRRFGASLTHS